MKKKLFLSFAAVLFGAIIAGSIDVLLNVEFAEHVSGVVRITHKVVYMLYGVFIHKVYKKI